MNSARKPLVALVALAVLLTFVDSLSAADQAAQAAGAKNTEMQKQGTRYPIHGKLAAVDNAAKTFTLKGAAKDRLFKVNAKTKITRHGKPATLAEAVVGEDVGGYVERQSDGSVLALSVRFGPKPAEAAADKGRAKQAETKAKAKAPATK